MPQLKTKSSTRSAKGSARGSDAFPHPTATDAHELICKMLEYEKAAKERGINLASGRFRLLTRSERQFYRAELIADYIGLAISSLGSAPGCFDASLEAFCSRVCEMEVPSVELLGTYLAALGVVTQEERLSRIPGLDQAIRRTMMRVLQSSVANLGKRTSVHAAA